MKRTSRTGIAWILCLALVWLGSLSAQGVDEVPFEGSRPAPEFPPGIEWLNTEKPLTLAGLKGKLVLLDFWTYCCINCMHVIPDLKKLETKYPKELVVIGIHSAKFDNEKQTDNIRQAIQRYEIEHPVANDRDFAIWRLYGARSWPTLVLINPNGRVIGYHSGEGVFDLFDSVIAQSLAHFEAKKELDRSPLDFGHDGARAPTPILSFPGKIVGDEKTGRIFFSDSNHNRVLVATLDGQVLDVIGGPESGFKDGDYASARFFRPQGVCYDGTQEVLYVADTENHSLRRVELKQKKVATLAGIGRQARQHNVEGDGKFTALNSPWDLLQIGDSLFVAMAGSHQLWRYDLKTGQAKVHAGSARENIVDGPLKEAALAQPSGLATDGDKLYFADSEVSAVRMADLAPTGRVDTIVGKGLFDFGDVDGAAASARLQHCLGVAWHDGALYVADTYNHKIKQIDLKTRQVVTFAGTGKPGLRDGDRRSAQLNEPSGLCYLKGRLLIADANNHLLRACDLKSGEMSTVVLKGYDQLERLRPSAPAGERLLIKSVRASPGSSTLTLQVGLPAGTKLNSLASSRYRAAPVDAKVIRLGEASGEVGKPRISLPWVVSVGQTTLNLDLDLYYCSTANEGLCYYKSARLVVPVEVAEGGAAAPVVEFKIQR
ncbi:MAG TPA: thioredoxin-like domain-containing protein [Candidatus Saccharimonadales bacterium]|nr:thioredoxin-like domain-containing protein [Candidatus Saccharimonadales bacterium]